VFVNSIGALGTARPTFWLFFYLGNRPQDAPWSLFQVPHNHKVSFRAFHRLHRFGKACVIASNPIILAAMKFALAIIAYLIIGLVLGWGILSAVKGNFWILAVGFLAYVIAFGRMGCLPKKSH